MGRGARPLLLLPRLRLNRVSHAPRRSRALPPPSPAQKKTAHVPAVNRGQLTRRARRLRADQQELKKKTQKNRPGWDLQPSRRRLLLYGGSRSQ